MVDRNFTPEQDRQLATEYAAGASFRDLVARHGGSMTSVKSAVARGGARKRTSGERVHWTAETQAEALRMYTTGASVKDVAAHFHVRTSVISDLLAETGTELHLGGYVHPRLRTSEQRQDLLDRYASGVSIASLGRQYDCSVVAIKTALRKSKAAPRPPGPPRRWTEELEAKAIEMYRGGRSQAEIAAYLGLSQGSVSNKLRARGVTTRGPSKRGENHHAWKGGRRLEAGYVWVVPDDDDLRYCKPNASGYAAEHRLVMGRAVGRPLTRRETVHHINGDRKDNRLENLQLRQGNHGAGVVFRCADCGSHRIEAVEIAST